MTLMSLVFHCCRMSIRIRSYIYIDTKAGLYFLLVSVEIIDGLQTGF